MGNKIKNSLIYLVSALVIGFVTWVLCGKYLGDLVHFLMPSVSHDEYIDFWFYSFFVVEVFVLSVSLFVVRWLLRMKK